MVVGERERSEKRREEGEERERKGGEKEIRRIGEEYRGALIRELESEYRGV